MCGTMKLKRGGVIVEVFTQKINEPLRLPQQAAVLLQAIVVAILFGGAIIGFTTQECLQVL